MVDRLRLWLNQPLRDADRPRLFAVAAAVIVVAAAALGASDDVGPAPERPRATISAATPAAVPAGLTPSPAAPAAPPSEEGTPIPGSEPSHADVARAKRAARRFLAGYLPYTYGRGQAAQIPAATNGLRRRLARQPPRVPASERGRRPRLVLLQSDGMGPDRGRLLAMVRDGRRRYSVRLEVTRSRGRWRVTHVGG